MERFKRFFQRLLPENASRRAMIAAEIAVALALIALIAFLLFGNDVTVDTILSFTPENLWLAALVFMGLYAVKSVVVVIYLKLLYVAAGLAFPLPVALAVNIVGTALEMTLPYLFGRSRGQRAWSRSRPASLCCKSWRPSARPATDGFPFSAVRWGYFRRTQSAFCLEPAVCLIWIL
ncbi:MAG: hypothetical protein LUE22_07850 [Oscillospiraceae bacterium]|nr:hypothetical protein [Oscillospiraceae bacterium]